MSESATFTQSSSPTKGLTNYDVEPVAKELYPAPMIGRTKRNRQAAWRKRFLSRGSLKKESTQMTHHTIEAMVDTLRTSVTAISSSNGANRDELLAKSFGEFKAALTGEVTEQLAKAAPEEPLYKGLCSVGRVCDLVGHLATKIATIQRGYESWQANNNVPPDDADPATPELTEALEGLLMHAEGVMRMAVNEHCAPYEDGDDMEGMHMVMVPVSGTRDEVAMKTYLPTDLAKFATDPADIDNLMADVGMGALAYAGVDIDALGKALAGGDLAKDAGMMGGAQATPDGTDPNAGGADIGGQDDTDPLDVLARLMSLGLIVIDQLKQEVDGTGGASDPTGEGASVDATDPSTDPSAGGGTDPTASAGGAAATDPDPNAVGKSAPDGDLAKLAGMSDEVLEKALLAKGIDLGALTKVAEANATLQAELTEIRGLSEQLLKMAEPPKAPLVTSGVVAKGNEDGLAATGAQPTEDLSKLSPLDRALKLTKHQQATTGRAYQGM